ncbi:MAG: DUF1214 domain-containing protein [Microscillaceae bacterium]|nr:DUF1214 domain-containing protein [Microscillaceae bacterium]
MLKRLIFRLLNLYRRLRLFFIRLRGKTPADIHARRVVSGRVWDEFCDSLKAAGAALVFPGTPRDAFQQAEGYRYLTRLLRAGLENFIEYADPAAPVLRRMVHETVKMGADNPDNYYQNAKIDGQYTYRLRGRRNTVHYLGFGTQKGDYGRTGGLAPSGYLEGKDLHLDADGGFEIILSTEPQPGNWLPMVPDTSLLIVRQTFLNQAGEQLATLHLECLDGNTQPALLSPQSLDEGLSSVSALVAGASLLFAKWARDFQQHSNQLPMFDPEVSNAAGGVAGITYYHSHWCLAEDEALLIRAKPPFCDYWNFQLNNYWMESLDYRYFRIHINKHTAVYAPDGSVQIVVAHQNPGLPNWIETVGHREGTMCFRWSNASETPTPQTQVLKFAELSQLPNKI